MFKLNVWSRLLSYIIICICIVVAQNRYELLALAILSLFISLLLHKTNSIVSSLLSMIMCLIYFGYPFLEIFMKIFLLVSYCTLMKDVLSIKDRRYLYEIDAYLLKGKNGNRYYVKKNYYKDLKEKNFDLYEDFPGYQNVDKFLKEEALMKTKQELNEIYLFNKLRYFKYYHRKNYVNKTKWQMSDGILIILSICVLIITVVVR